jgi:hypothetical protein
MGLNTWPSTPYFFMVCSVQQDDVHQRLMWTKEGRNVGVELESVVSIRLLFTFQSHLSLRSTITKPEHWLQSHLDRITIISEFTCDSMLSHAFLCGNPIQQIM